MTEKENELKPQLNSQGEPVTDTVLEVQDVVTDGNVFCKGLFDRLHAEAGLGPVPEGPISVIKEAKNG